MREIENMKSRTILTGSVTQVGCASAGEVFKDREEKFNFV